jgi:hypothetical protein
MAPLSTALSADSSSGACEQASEVDNIKANKTRFLFMGTPPSDRCAKETARVVPARTRGLEPRKHPKK